MWQERRVLTLGLGGWTWLGFWIWLWPGVMVMLWHGLMGFRLLVALLAGRALGMAVYNRLAFWHGGVRMVYDAGSLIRVPLQTSWRALTVYSAIMGVVLGVGLMWGGPLSPGWAISLCVVLSVMATHLTIILYNHVVVPFYGGWQWQEERGVHRIRIVGLVPNQTRLMFSTLVYAWVVVALVVMVLALSILLAFMARVLPKGFFSIGIVVFAAFVMAIFGFLLAVLAGWWFYWGAYWYNRWAQRGGGISFDVRILEVSL